MGLSKEALYRKYPKTSPRFDPEGSGYDYRSAKDAGMLSTGGHLGTRDPRTGMILKGRGHETFEKARKESQPFYQTIKGLDNRYYSVPVKPPWDTTEAVNTLFAEAGGGNPEEIDSAASTILNRMKANPKSGLEGFSSYHKKSDEYMKAKTGNMNAYEKMKWREYGKAMNELMTNPSKIEPWWFMENVKRYGDPDWLDETDKFRDVGRQRFYTRKTRS